MFLFKSQPTRFIFLYFTSVGFYFFFLPLTFRFCPVAISWREGGGTEGGKKRGGCLLIYMIICEYLLEYLLPEQRGRNSTRASMQMKYAEGCPASFFFFSFTSRNNAETEKLCVFIMSFYCFYLLGEAAFLPLAVKKPFVPFSTATK